ncbi:Bud20p NDAI_0C06580 [Naumovozyma dairenensis CBS 421]|uniref:C2H2-type domain-containing protein n=1 Tax=Naumovozyma dairenensis (strain ATCC 10597 / BCRC 20456 / CBS 421 / NBRC 0211 / NRRL Y-12639) TaxID=1071378 RepID=G0W956_NAUDC|nr:hypothetical protein NDAI_0C06580 [Naumovozyma dairenensis CBS 421]CCD24317.1 hypothetical protein NDAI_0C06580 [Naumovozyma dairenensis CBS 421]
MGRYSVKRYKTKRRTKDLDLIFNELTSKSTIQTLLNQQLDETKPGLGQHYCIHCAKYFETAIALKTHLKTKVHKRRVKELKGVPYTQEVADAAAGYNLNKFLNRVQEINSKSGVEKTENETLLKEHLDETLANVKTTEPTLPWAQNTDETSSSNGTQAESLQEGEVLME